MRLFDTVIVGTGGAGLAAAIALSGYTDNFIAITAGNIGNSNTSRAHDGIRIPVLSEDNAEIHFRDTYAGGNCNGDVEFVRTMTCNSLSVLNFLNSLGLDFDMHTGKYIVRTCEGISHPRVLSKGDIPELQ